MRINHSPSPKGENQIVIVPGANNCLSRSDVTAASDVLSAVKVVICQLETDPTLVLHSAEVVKRGGNGVTFINYLL
jgi:sugar/nucleoside kinase (ribokinase family)